MFFDFFQKKKKWLQKSNGQNDTYKNLTRVKTKNRFHHSDFKNVGVPVLLWLQFQCVKTIVFVVHITGELLIAFLVFVCLCLNCESIYTVLYLFNCIFFDR